MRACGAEGVREVVRGPEGPAADETTLLLRRLPHPLIFVRAVVTVEPLFFVSFEPRVIEGEAAIAADMEGSESGG